MKRSIEKDEQEARGEIGRRTDRRVARDIPYLRSEQRRESHAVGAEFASPIVRSEAKCRPIGGVYPESGHEQQRPRGVLRVRSAGGAGAASGEIALHGGAAAAAVPNVRPGWERLHHGGGAGSLHGEAGPRSHGGGADRDDQRG